MLPSGAVLPLPGALGWHAGSVGNTWAVMFSRIYMPRRLELRRDTGNSFFLTGTSTLLQDLCLQNTTVDFLLSQSKVLNGLANAF